MRKLFYAIQNFLFGKDYNKKTINGFRKTTW